MSDPPRTRAQERAQEEAAEWLARLGHHAISTQTVRDFRDWRDDPDNDAAYTEAEAFWEASGRHAADPEIQKMTAAALDRGRPRAGWPAWLALFLRPPRPFVLAGLATVATLLLAAAGGWWALRPLDLRTAPGEQRIVRLADGSRVHLNVDSAVRVRLTDGERRLELRRGEALFSVARDPGRPFVVAADGATVRALGTRFDVRRDAAGLTVTLLEGIVEVRRAADGQAWTLAPDQALAVPPAGPARPTATDAARATSWTTGRLAFRGTPLAEAVAEVNRYGARKVVLEGASLPARPISGVFDVGDTEAFATGAAAVLGLERAPGPDGTLVLRAARAPTRNPAALPARPGSPPPALDPAHPQANPPARPQVRHQAAPGG